MENNKKQNFSPLGAAILLYLVIISLTITICFWSKIIEFLTIKIPIKQAIIFLIIGVLLSTFIVVCSSRFSKIQKRKLKKVGRL